MQIFLVVLAHGTKLLLMTSFAENIPAQLIGKRMHALYLNIYDWPKKCFRTSVTECRTVRTSSFI